MGEISDEDDGRFDQLAAEAEEDRDAEMAEWEAWLASPRQPEPPAEDGWLAARVRARLAELSALHGLPWHDAGPGYLQEWAEWNKDCLSALKPPRQGDGTGEHGAGDAAA